MLFGKYAALALAFLALAGPGMARTPELSPRQIIDRAIVTDRTLREKRTAYDYDFELKTERLDRKDRVLSTRELQAKVRPGKDITYSIDITEDSENTSESARAKQAEKMEEARKLMTKIELEKLVEHYDYALEGAATLLGRPAHVVRFTPKENFQVKSREEKVLRAISGRLWIDQESFSILKSEGKLGRPTAVAWFFATMRELEFSYNAFLLPNGDPAPASFSLFLDVQIPFGYQRQRQSSTMTNYRKAD